MVCAYALVSLGNAREGVADTGWRDGARVAENKAPDRKRGRRNAKHNAQRNAQRKARQPDKEKAREYNQRGQDASCGGQYLKAIVQFHEAKRYYDSALLEYNLARVHQLAGHDDKALLHYKAFLDRREEAAKFGDLVDKAKKQATSLEQTLASQRARASQDSELKALHQDLLSDIDELAASRGEEVAGPLRQRHQQLLYATLTLPPFGDRARIIKALEGLAVDIDERLDPPDIQGQSRPSRGPAIALGLIGSALLGAGFHGVTAHAQRGEPNGLDTTLLTGAGFAISILAYGLRDHGGERADAP
jgi:hypothetical protein